jgi:energy-coupling factor transporter transmembrane protein EcfT
LTLFLLHGLLTPGEPFWPLLPWLSWQGVREGGQQLLRLWLLIAFAWVLVRSTTPMQWVIGLYRLFGRLQRWHVPVQRSCALLAFALGSMPALLQEARQLQEEGRLRYRGGSQRLTQRLLRVAEKGQALLLRLLQRASAQEESLRLRGFAQGLPFVVLYQPHWHWRDTLLLGGPVLLWIVQGSMPG